MKILFVSSGNTANPINIILKNQGDSLRNLGIELSYFTINGRGIKSYLRHLFVLKKYLKKNKFDLIHAHYSFSAIIATLASSRPIVVSLMGSDTKAHKGWILLLRFLNKFFWNALIVKSESMKNDIGIKNAVIVPNGVDLRKIKPKNKVRELAKDTILFVGNPERNEKNYSLAKAAFSLLKNQDIDLKIVFSVPHNKVVEEINNSSVLVLTSLYEGSPNIIKEAMACNCPIVSTSVGDVQWLFGEMEGHYITSFDPQDVASKLSSALKFSKEVGKTKGRDQILKLEIDSETIANNLANLYEKILT